MRELIQQLREATNEVDVDVVANKFLSITPAKRMNQVKSALGVLLPAYAKGEIYNTDYKNAKDILGYAVEGGWNERTKHFWAGSGGSPESTFMWWFGNVGNLHDLISKKKKIDKLKPTTVISKEQGRTVADVNPAYIQVAREFVNAAYPVALIVKEMKSKIIKGRKPNPAAVARRAAQLAKKDVKTCGCCFRSIARLRNGFIADHGYTLPQKWHKTASCPGGMFMPLEVSDDGLKYMVKIVGDRVKALTREVSRIPKLKKLSRKKNWKGDIETLTPDSPGWSSALKIHKANLEQELKRTKDDFKGYKDKLTHWKPVA